eukprot:5453952-Ditylum_brightwellii.AAC.1
MIFCNFCKERWFSKKSNRANTIECTECEKTRKKNNSSCRTFAAKNNMDPYQDGFPYHLPKFFKTKEMLIALVYHVVKTYLLKGGTIGYKDDVHSKEQGIGGLVSSFRIDKL